MDTLSHGLWGGVAFGRKNKWQFIAAIAFGTAPDIISFGAVFGQELLSHAPFAGAPALANIPAYVFNAYNSTHSLVVALLACALGYALLKRKALPILAWPLHILLDIPTHSLAFFPTPYAWPFATPFVDGIPWNTPWVFFLNWGLLVVAYLWWRFWKRPKKQD